ncbi:myb/SANT-like DNA-binding domain-containing protein 3 [Euwallacea fornicatus]|uniref:myb/SANT-like DNA-binding domain-containing protein 3 n=1 Tax=Euwallacea fornicatus TaxID=995702 RepID=UPI00338DFA8B
MSNDKSFESTRKRSPNFTKKENKTLVDLIQKYELQIEIKKTDHASNVKKSRAWQELAKDFNARLGGSPHRSAAVLKHRYENIKKEARRTLKLKRNNSVNGSRNVDDLNLGEITTNTNDEENEGHNSYDENEENSERGNGTDLKEYIRIKMMTEDEADIDDGSGMEEERLMELPTQPKVEIEQSDSTIWQSSPYNPLEDLQKKCFLEEHKLKVQQMKDKHALEMDLIKQKHKEIVRMMRQEHESKMEFLELEKTVGIINKI